VTWFQASPLIPVIKRKIPKMAIYNAPKENSKKFKTIKHYITYTERMLHMMNLEQKI
jgi:hypothetical protein